MKRKTRNPEALEVQALYRSVYAEDISAEEIEATIAKMEAEEQCPEFQAEIQALIAEIDGRRK